MNSTRPITKTKKKFAFDVGWVFASTIIIFFLHFFQNPIVARFLGPDGLGLFSMITMLAGIVALVAGFGVDSAVVKYVAEYKDDPMRLQALVSSGLITMIILGMSSSIALFILSDTLAGVFNMPSLSLLLKIYAFIFPFSLTYAVIIALFNGLREMKYYSFINTFQGILTFSFILTFLFIGFGVKGALGGTILAVIASMGISAILMRKFVHFTISNYKTYTKKLTSFGSQLMLGDIINNVNYQADALLIGYFLTATDVGYYAVAVSLSRFFWRIPQSIQMIAYPAASEYWANDKISSLNHMIDKSMKYSACLLLIVGLGTWFFAKEIIVFLFGGSFISSILPFKILLVGTLIFGIVKSIGGTLAAIGRPDLSLKITATGTIASVMLNILLIPRIGIAGAAVATITSFIIITTLSIYFIMKLTEVNIDAKWYASAFTITLLAVAVFSACSEWIKVYILGSLILSIYAIIIFLFFLNKEDKTTFKELIRSVIFRRSD